MRYLRFIFLAPIVFNFSLVISKKNTKNMQITKSQKHFFTINLDPQNQVIVLFLFFRKSKLQSILITFQVIFLQY